MFVFSYRPKDQKELYFKLSDLFKIETNSTKKIAGVYAIYVNDTCLYVGQSKNITSRIATHLSGKYKTATKVIIYQDEYYQDDLIPSEKFLMKKLEPTENLLIDFSEDIKHDDLIEYFKYSDEFNTLELPHFVVLLDRYSLFVHTSEMPLDLHDHNHVSDLLKEFIK